MQQAKLNKKQFRDVKVTVDNSMATLSGTVDLYEYKIDAEKRVLHAKGITVRTPESKSPVPTSPTRNSKPKLGES